MRLIPGYAIVNRGIAYVCRNISNQQGVEYDSKTYDQIKKVYSIWILPDSSKELDGTIRKYYLQQDLVNGMINEDNFDKMCIVEIYTSRNHSHKHKYKTWDDLLMPLHILLTNQYDASTKKKILKEEYEFKLKDETEKEMEHMWNYADSIEQVGIQKGTQNTILRSIHSYFTLHLSLSQIQDLLMKEFFFSKEECEYYLNLAIQEFKEN